MSERAIDRGTLFGILLSLSGIAAGLWLDGGSVTQILQPTAAAIVIGGTLGAVMFQFPLATIREAVAHVRHLLSHRGPLGQEVVEELVAYCMQVRRNGVLSLDPHLDEIDDAFLRKSLTLAVDGLRVDELRSIMEVDLDLCEEREDAYSAVLYAAGGFAPTLGIVGAVIGLIQVMQRMDHVESIGKGIAVAFVSTLYGIGSANLFFLPLAGKLKIRMREHHLKREMTLEAVVAIIEGVSGRLLRERLKSYVVARAVVPAKAKESKAEIELVRL